MKKFLKAKLLMMVIEGLIETITPDMMKEGLDKLFDFIETKVEDSSTPTDDAVILPLLKIARDAFDIPDDD